MVLNLKISNSFPFLPTLFWKKKGLSPVVIKINTEMIEINQINIVTRTTKENRISNIRFNMNMFYLLKICAKIASVIAYVGVTPFIPNPPEAKVLPECSGLSEA